MSVGTKKAGYEYDISCKSLTDGRSLSISLPPSDDKIGIDIIKTVIENLCEVEVSKVKEVINYETSKLTKDGFSYSQEYKFLGNVVKATRQFLPFVKKTKNKDDVEAQLKLLYGPTLKITGWVERW